MTRRRGKWLVAMGVLAALGLLAWGASTFCGSDRPKPGGEVVRSVEPDAPLEDPSGDASSDSAIRELLEEVDALGDATGNVGEHDAALQAAQSIERVMGELGEAHAFTRDGDVASVATWVLESYRDGGATLFEASYLDVLGRAWGCVVADAAWVDVCCVRERESGSSLVEVVRLDAEAWEEALAKGAL